MKTKQAKACYFKRKPALAGFVLLDSELDSEASKILETGKLENWEGMRVTKRWAEIEELDFFAKLEALCDEIWKEVANWDRLARETMGMQLVRAADSVGAALQKSYTFTGKTCYGL